MTDIKSNLNFLRSIGIQEWILGGDSNFVEFTQWLSTTISERNIATDGILLGYSDFQTNGIVFGPRDIQNALADIQTKYPSIWTIKEADMRNVEHQLHDATSTEDHYVNALHYLKLCKTHIIEDLASSSKLLTNFDKMVKECTDRCMQKVKDLQDKKQNNYKSIRDVQQCFTEPQKFPLFIHQMPLEQYLGKCDSFLTSAETYFGRSFAIQSHSDSKVPVENHADIVADLQEIKNRLCNTKYELCCQRSEVYAQRKLIEYYKTHNWTPVNDVTLRNEIRSAEIRNENILDLKKEVLFNKLEAQFEQIAEKYCELVIFDGNKDKELRAKKRLEYLANTANVISDGILNAECLWILMRIDLGRAKKRQCVDDIFEKYKMDTRNSHKRCEALQKKMGSIVDLDVVNAFLIEWQRIMPSVHVESSLAGTPIELLEHYLSPAIVQIDEVKWAILNNLNRIRGEECSQQTREMLNDLNTSETRLLIYARDGPVDRPIFWNMKFVHEKINLQNELDCSNMQLEHLKQEFQAFQNRYNMDTLWRQQRGLWIWFLKEPKKILKAINLARIETQHLSKTAVLRPVSGISRKQ